MKTTNPEPGQVPDPDNYTGTYSPDDNKLRLYAMHRLDKELYDRVKAAGFRWAPRQDLFYSTWNPPAADILAELCGEIGDEDSDLQGRAEERSERFEVYSDKRAAEAEQAHAYVENITDGIPLGQPILVGHHSEKHARRDQKRIESGMRRAVKAFATSEYWTRRAAAALSHAKYKERPDVRARRIKKITAEKRKAEKEIKQAESNRERWGNFADLKLKRRDSEKEITARDKALYLANDYRSGYGLWSELDKEEITPEQAQARAITAAEGTIKHWARWLEHYENRLLYEVAMLGESGGLAADKFDIKTGGQVLVAGSWLTVERINKQDGQIVSVSTNARYVRVKSIETVQDYKPPTAADVKKTKAANKLPPLVNYPGDGIKEITRDDWKRKPKDYKGTRYEQATDEHGKHRYRVMMYQDPAKEPGRFTGLTLGQVFITDQKRVDPPPPDGPASDLPPPPMTDSPRQVYKSPPKTAAAEKFGAMAESLKAGVKTVTAPQLFPTPAKLAEKMAELADIEPGHRVLEPSAGTGALIDAAITAGADPAMIKALEINTQLCDRLRDKYPELGEVATADFIVSILDYMGDFDRIIMNPPFIKGVDIKHIEQAAKMLAPGGRLVALCAGGPRQKEKLQPLAVHWEDLPPGSFKNAGTNVNVSLLVIEKDDDESKSPGISKPAEFSLATERDGTLTATSSRDGGQLGLF